MTRQACVVAVLVAALGLGAACGGDGTGGDSAMSLDEVDLACDG